ncbi:NAD(+) diphosphatase [Deinococcus sp. Marseille-Q6407]|uniref:NAD(+) diphosphatase n=1 Tax=Deinococcus sp. Marseille-Q6407 TaxID=2969223 RepID=UPI0021C06E5D|nr:NAD(+) diphosphatase [Deinococcus sp. Marseille-Q6407]
MLAFTRPDDFLATPIPLTPEHRLILIAPDGRSLLPPGPEGWPRLGDVPAKAVAEAPISLGHWQGAAYAVAHSTSGFAPDAGAISLRQLAAAGDEETSGLAGYAVQLLEFHQTHRFCGRCGTPTEALGREHARRCPACGLTVYPRVAPAIMALIWRGEGPEREFLLARGPRHTPGMFSVVAGFVEPSETLEDCCHREVREELGVTIRSPQYRMSQPWPLPHSLMVAFSAEYVAGDIVPQPGEIEEARWFRADQLPPIPGSISCAHHLIQAGVREALDDLLPKRS